MFQNPYLQQIPFLILIGVVWYFFFIRPGGKEKAEKQSFFDNLEVGDYIVTIGGIHGIITDLQDEQIMITASLTSRTYQMKIQKSAVSIEFTQKIYPKKLAEEKQSQATQKKAVQVTTSPRKTATKKLAKPKNKE